MIDILESQFGLLALETKRWVLDIFLAWKLKVSHFQHTIPDYVWKLGSKNIRYVYILELAKNEDRINRMQQ